MSKTSTSLALLLASAALAGCERAPKKPVFPLPERPVAKIIASRFSDEPIRDRAGEARRIFEIADVRPGMKVADIGAGSGFYALRLSRVVGPKGRVYAQDVTAAYLADLKKEVARRKLANVELVLGAPDDPRLPGPVDRALLIHMYHEIAQPYGLLWHLAASLKPGARVGVVDLDRPTERHGTPPRLLRCILDCRDMVSLETARFDAPVRDGGVLVPDAPGLGITVDRDVLGDPVAAWGD